MHSSRYTIVRLPEPRRTRQTEKIVFRGPSVLPKGLAPEDPRILPEAAELAREHTPTVETVELAREEAEDARRDERYLVWPTLPLTIVQPDPQSSDDAHHDADDAPHTWGLEATGALSSSFDGRGARVAVLDSGIDLDHEAFEWLRAEERILYKNFTGGREDDVSDRVGHGTHCAGTICGSDVGGVRIGVARKIDRLIVAKVLGPGGGDNDAIVRALFWAFEKKAQIVSLSLGIDFPGRVQALVETNELPIAQATSMALEDYRNAIESYGELTAFLNSWGMLVVAATGNESARPDYTINVSPPAAIKGVVSVAALERHADGLRVARFSNTRPHVSAPGVNVRSAKVGGGLTSKNGTSMAAPHVAGVAALWCQKIRQEQGELPPNALAGKLSGSASLDPLAQGFRAARDVGSGLVRVP